MSEVTQGQLLAANWITHFYSADQAYRWTAIEQERTLWLDHNTLLIGRIDAQGEDDDGNTFFADWKSLSARMKNRIGEVKAEYEFSPQMLTYQLLLAKGDGKPAERFLVRWACKTEPPIFHYQWYDVDEGAIAWWHNLVKNVAAHIRHDLAGPKPWMTNLNACRSKYGPAYNCPYLDVACPKQKWDAVPLGAAARGSHLELERNLQAKAKAGKPIPLILDATRISTWLSCNERYRREYHDGPDGTGWRTRPGEAKDVGTEMHELLARYYGGLAK